MRGKAGLFCARQLGASDPYFSDVALLLHFNGSNASTTFTDSSGSPKTVTAHGNAKLSTAQSKFGGASLYLDGSSWVTVSNSTAFAFGTGDFTIELWLRVDQTQSSNQYVLDFNELAVIQVLNEYGMVGPLFSPNPYAASVGGSTSITSNQWHHLAVVRSGATTSMYINGASIGSETDTSNYLMTDLTIGMFSGGYPPCNLFGYIDDLRITKGIARYTANFTPPTAAFPDS